MADAHQDGVRKMAIGREHLIIIVAAIFVPICSRAAEEKPNPESAARADVERTVKEFLTAFERLDWERFRAAFDDDATVFFPVPEPPHRFTGRAQFEPQFKKVFTAIRASNPGGPPYHRLKPDDLTVEILAHDVALASFLLTNEERTARRTLVLVRRQGKWLIHHLHASNVPKSVRALDGRGQPQK